MAPPIPEFDVLIFGGGVAGLWTLGRLNRLGYACLLFERTALGSGQTIASQGIIHGGVKYALSGEPSSAATSIAQMPRIWEECLGGRGEIDLSSCRVLSREQYLWTTPGLISRIAGFGASKVIRAGVDRVAAPDRPEAFKRFPDGIDVYRVPEIVIDPRSLVESLALPANSRGRLALLPGGASPTIARAGDAWSVTWPGGVPLTIRARALVLASGEGNAPFMSQFRFGLAAGKPQLRPLHMVMMREAPFELFGHCIGSSALPRLTITTAHDAASGDRIWYIGGAIAEGDAIRRDESSQIAACRKELAECVPGFDPGSRVFATLRINRAEGTPTEGDGHRPATPTLYHDGSAILGWPTKLAFAPAFASRIIDLLGESRVQPSNTEPPMPAVLGQTPPIAQPPWETATWT